MATIRQLEYLTAVVEEASFTRAAERCGVAQPSLSQQIQSLESQLGETLLKRRSRRVEVTPAGAVAYEKALVLLRNHRELLAAFADPAEVKTGRVFVGIIPTMAPQMLPSLLTEFRRSSPRVQVQVREAQTSDLVRMATRGEVDFAVLSDLETEEARRLSLEVKQLHREAMFLAVPAFHPLGRRGRSVAVSEINPDEMMTLTEGHCLRGQALTVCRREPSSDAIQCEQLATVIAMVAAGLGVTFIPEMAVARHVTKRIRFLPLRNPAPHRAINLMRCLKHDLSPAAEALMRLVETFPFVGRRGG